MPKASSTLQAAIVAATSKKGASNAKRDTLGSTLRLMCWRDANAAATDPATTGTKFLDCAMAGPLNVNGTTGAITSLGALSDVTTHTAADLATGASVMRITGNGQHLEYTLGLTGSGKEFTVAANLTPGQPFAFSPSASIAPLASLPVDEPGGGTPAPTPVGSTIATPKVQNNSGSSVATGFIPPMLGHPFKMGDVPSGHYPMFELEDGTFVPCTMFNEARWADGSLQFASFLLRIPVGLAAGASLNVRIKATTTAPGTSGRSLADFSSGGADLQVAVTGLDNLSGDWVSRLNQGITDADDITVYGDGPVGKVWKVRQQFMQGGSNHGQLECYWYIAALQNASGGLYGLRYLGKITQPWYNVDSPAKDFRSFSVALLKNGASTVRDLVATLGAPATAKYPTTLISVPVSEDGIPVRINWMEASNLSGLQPQTLVHLTGTTLPTGTNSTTPYFVNTATYAGHIGLHSDSNIAFSSRVQMSGAASADLALIPYPFVAHFGSLYTAGPSAKWDDIQAGGTVATDAPTRIIHDRAYWQASGMMPPYATTTVDPQADNGGYVSNSMKPIERYTSTTGERSDLGLHPGWSVKHFISQRELDEKVVRSTGLMNAHAPVTLYDSVTRSIKPVNNKNYTGMPTTSISFRWPANSDTAPTGFTGPTRCYAYGLVGLGFDHMPSLSAYPYMVTGEPQFMDSLIDMANQTILTNYAGGKVATANDGSSPRNITIAGVDYYGVLGFDMQSRAAAWALRDVSYAAALLPDAHKCKQYFKDIYTNSYAAMKAYHDNVATTFWKSSGMMAYRPITAHNGWMNSYLGQAMAQGYRMNRDPNNLFMLDHLVKWFGNVHVSHGGWHVSGYRFITRTGASADGPIITSMSQTAYMGPIVNWSSDTSQITFDPSYDGYVPKNGDVIMWEFEPSVNELSAPGGCTAATVYYLVNVSGLVCQISATPGGAPITLTNSSRTTAYVRMSNPPTDKTMGGRLEADGYASNIRGMLRLAKLAGATVNAALLTELNAKLAATSYAPEPRYDLADTV